jgi:prevent-host-death family protein
MSKELEIQELGVLMADAVERVRHGEQVTIAEHGRPVARIIPVEQPGRRPQFGSLKGMIEMAEDFNAPLPEEEIREWEK